MKKKKKHNPLFLPTQKGSIDFSILLVVTVLCAIGLVMVYSASYYYALHYSGAEYDGYYYLKRQGGYMAIAYAIMLGLSLFNYHNIQKFGWLALAVSIALLGLVLLFGELRNGARRWLNVGISIQPSEVAKFGLIFYMCTYMTKNKAMLSAKASVKHLFNRRSPLLWLLLCIFVIALLIMAQPNMSMAVIVGGIGIILLFIGGIDIKYFIVLAGLAVVAFAVLAIAEPYRLERMTSFSDPWQDAQGSGYQLIQSLYAIGSGGWLGKGLGNSYQKLLYMTYGESDFIFAIICEELGILGGLIIILMYAWIVYRGMRISLTCRDHYGSLLAAGISIVFGMQVFINIAVVTGLAPTTGQPLPFLSSGGTSLIIFMSAMGVLLNISREAESI